MIPINKFPFPLNEPASQSSHLRPHKNDNIIRLNFRCMLTQFVEREMEEVELKDVVEPELMHRILTSIYGSVDVVITSANVQELLLAATYFQVDDLQSLCVRYLKEKIDKRWKKLSILLNKFEGDVSYKNIMIFSRAQRKKTRLNFCYRDSIWIFKLVFQEPITRTCHNF